MSVGTKRLKAWFFTITSVIRRDGTTGGVRFRTSDKPTQDTMQDLVYSSAFMTESDNRAKPYIGSDPSAGDQQGLVVMATDAQAKANTAQLTNMSLVVAPSQLPTSENLNASANQDMPVTTLTVDTASTTTRNQYRFRIADAWVTWLVSRIFKQGGTIGQVPIKNSSTNYDWSYGQLANDSTFITSLLANTTFVNNLTTQIITNNPTAITDGLAVGFMRYYPVASVPTKWLRMDGSAISRTTYATLFSLIGTTYGVGDGSTTFNLPDFRDKLSMGYSGTKALGSTAGSDTHTIASGNLPPHIHGISSGAGTTNSAGDHSHYMFTPNAVGDGTSDIISFPEQSVAYRNDDTTNPGDNNYFYLMKANNAQAAAGRTAVTGNHSHTLSLTGNTDNGGFANTAINHLNPYVAVNYIIKALA